MEFDQNGLITPEALVQLLELERIGRRDAEAHAHNMDAAQIAALGRRIVDHCLKSVAAHRDLLEQEGALNVSIERFLKNDGYSLQKLDSHGTAYHHSKTDGKQVARVGTRSTRSSGVLSDLVIDARGDRVELKTSAFATSKDRVPDALFEKDLAHLTRDPYIGDFERHPSEGLNREERSAEMAILVADKKIAQGNGRLCQMVGSFNSVSPHVGATSNGLTYEVYLGKYHDSEVLNVQRKRPFRITEFVVLLFYPSRQY